MPNQPIQFNDGSAYERYMGIWSQLVGEVFLNWLAPATGLRWLDVGCGNGAFTEMIVARCAPVLVEGIDPSEAQLLFARKRLVAGLTHFRAGDAMAVPFPAGSFDAAVMPLVIFFVPDPAKGVAEMARVVGSGGTVSAYAWDMVGGGFPYETLQAEMRAMGVDPLVAPNPGAAQIDTLQKLWMTAGLTSIETRVITVSRTFADFNDYWATVLKGPSVAPKLAAMSSEQIALLKARMQTCLPIESNGRITYSARAHAVKGQVPIGRHPGNS